MRKFLLISTIVAAFPFVASADPIFATGTSITIAANGIQNGPPSFSNTILEAPGTYSLDGGLLNLTVSIVNDPSTPQSEWIVFRYNTANGLALDPSGINLQIQQGGIVTAVPANFIGVSDAFIGPGGMFLSETSSVFGQPLHAVSPVPGEAGLGQTTGNLGFTDTLGTGPFGQLGFFINPFSQMSSFGIDISQVDGFEQALQFAPENPIPPPPPPPGVPEPASLVLLGTGLVGLAALHRRKQRRS